MTTGCRRNAANATLCLCDSNEYCNARSLVSTETARPLPIVECYEFVDTPHYSTLPDDGRPATTCRGNACFYTEVRRRRRRLHLPQSHIVNVAGEREVQRTADCSLIPQLTFDLQLATQWPGPGAIANACYLQQV